MDWCSTGYYLSERPLFTLDPLFHQGAYYVQEASSMFLEQLKQLVDLQAPLVILDLCAAPGGKSTHLMDLFPNSLIVSNELIRSRAKILAENCTKWGNSNSIVTNSEPAFLGQLVGMFDVILIDAPCSGEGMFRKDVNARNEWSLNNVDNCVIRQQDIVRDILPALKENGLLIYSTCTFNEKENDQNIRFFCNEWDLEIQRLPILPSSDIVVTENGYQFYPHKTKGEGFYMSFLLKTTNSNEKRLKNVTSKDIKPVTVPLKQQLASFIQFKNNSLTTLDYFEYAEMLYLFPAQYSNQLYALQQHCRIVQFGTKIGKFIKNKLHPEHDLLLNSSIHLNTFSQVELNYDQAVSFLKKENFILDNTSLGWVILTFNNLPLGWIKSMGNRFNNYYPNELKIYNSNLKGNFSINQFQAPSK
jgi:NOL1/NOP2/fmu family ribosome biogenesis protein